MRPAPGTPPGPRWRYSEPVQVRSLQRRLPGRNPMRPRTRRTVTTGVAARGASCLLLAACSPASADDAGVGGETSTVTFRLWDENAAAAYEKSFAASKEDHPDINYELETVPWDNYWERLPQDIGSGTMADIF